MTGLRYRYLGLEEGAELGNNAGHVPLHRRRGVQLQQPHNRPGQRHPLHQFVLVRHRRRALRLARQRSAQPRQQVVAQAAADLLSQLPLLDIIRPLRRRRQKFSGTKFLKLNLLKYFFPVLCIRIRIILVTRIRIRIKEKIQIRASNKLKIQIRIKLKSWFRKHIKKIRIRNRNRICIRVLSRIRIRIKVMRIHNTGFYRSTIFRELAFSFAL